MIYLLAAVVLLQLFQYYGHFRMTKLIRKKDKATEMTMNNLQQWIVSREQSTMKNMDHLLELTQTLYVRIRMIDLTLRSKVPGEPQGNGQEFRELEAMLTEPSQKEAIEKIRGEDLQYFYTTLIDELRYLNKQISKNGSRTELFPGTGTVSGSRPESRFPVNGWHSWPDKIR